MGCFDQRTTDVFAIFDGEDQQPVSRVAQPFQCAHLQFGDIAGAGVLEEKSDQVRTPFNKVARCSIGTVTELTPRLPDFFANGFAHIRFVIVDA